MKLLIVPKDLLQLSLLCIDAMVLYLENKLSMYKLIYLFYIFQVFQSVNLIFIYFFPLHFSYYIALLCMLISRCMNFLVINILKFD
jgi:hypothetical protein